VEDSLLAAGLEAGFSRAAAVARGLALFPYWWKRTPGGRGDTASETPGAVYLMTEDRFQRVDISRVEAVKCLRRLGLGANQLLGRRIGEQAQSSGDHRHEAQAVS
jgi:hypothetical protein